MSTLFLVATPIGNLNDISTRALQVLRSVSLIAAEDTRQTAKLLGHFDLHTPVTSYYEHNKLSKLDTILTALGSGDIALVSDAGTPALNDPGFELVRAALEAGHSVSPIPGPCAPIAALVASGLPTDTFLYLGYLPRRSIERRKFLTSVAGAAYTLLFLETPHRLLEALADILAVLGDRNIAVARELTKLHEEIYRGTVSSAEAHYRAQPPRGEITLVVSGQSTTVQVWTEAHLRAVIKERLASGQSASQLATSLAGEAGWPKRKIYRLIVEAS